MLSKGGTEVLYQRNHLLLGAFREVAAYIHLSYSLSEDAVGNAHSPLPAGSLLLCTGHLVGVEVPLCGVEFIGEGTCLAAYKLAKEVCLEGFKVCFCHVCRKGVEVGGLLDNHFVLGGDSGCGANLVEAYSGPFCNNLCGGHGIVDGSHVTVLLPCPRSGGDCVFNGHVFSHQFLCPFHSGEGENLLKISLVAFLQSCIFGLEVVVTVSHAKAALTHVEDLDVGVGEVRLHTCAIEAAFSVEVHLAKKGCKLVFTLNCLDFGYIRLDGLCAKGVAGGGVEGHLVEVTDFLLHCAGLGLQGCHLLEQGIEVFLSLLAEGVKAAVAGEFGPEGVLGLPAAGCILIEIHLGTCGGVKVCQIQCGGSGFGSARRHCKE